MKSLLNVRLAERRMSKTELSRLVGFGRKKLWQVSRDGPDGIDRLRLCDLAAVAEALSCKVGDLYEE